MWRVIVRISFFHDFGSRLRNHLAVLFAEMGLANTRTGTWESDRVEPLLAAERLGRILAAVADVRSVTGADPSAELNHFWIYIDRAEG